MSKQKTQEAAPVVHDSNTLIEAKIENMKQLQMRGVNPFPYRFNVTAMAGDLQKKYAHLQNGETTKTSVRMSKHCFISSGVATGKHLTCILENSSERAKVPENKGLAQYAASSSGGAP